MVVTISIVPLTLSHASVSDITAAGNDGGENLCPYRRSHYAFSIWIRSYRKLPHLQPP